MATRFYLSADAETTPITPSADGSWEDVSILARALCDTVKRGLPMTDVEFSDSDATNKDICFLQHISSQLTAGQTITGSQALKAQIRVSEDGLSNNMFFAIGIRVIASDGVTVQKTIMSLSRDNTEAAVTVLTNRQFTATTLVTNYTTVTGDRLVIETGMGGDPGVGGTHTSTMRFGDADASDLSENDTSTTDNNPWVELADTLTFVTPSATKLKDIIGCGVTPRKR